MRNAIPLQNEISKPWFIISLRPYVLLSCIVLLLYGCTFWFGFSPTDEHWIIISERGNLSSFSNLPMLFKTSLLGIYYRPMLSLSLMIDTIIGNGSMINFHVTNVLLHISCCILVFRFFILLGFQKQSAFFVALIFAVHPVNVHAVAWIPGRNDMLMTLFALLSSVSLLRFIRDRKFYWLLLHFLFFACVLFTKESAIVLPAVFLLLYLFFEKDKNKIRIAVIIFFWITITIGWWIIRNLIVPDVDSFLFAVNGKNLIAFLSSMLMHTGKILLPVEQSVMPLVNYTSLWPFALVIAVTFILVLKFGLKNKKLACFGLFWFIMLIVLPAWTGSVNGNGEHYEHRDYTPLVGALLFLSQINIPISKTRISSLVIVVAIAFTIKTAFRLPVYRTELSYSLAGTVEAPSNSLFHDAAGSIYVEEKKYPEAIQYFSNAIKIDSLNTDYRKHRAEAYYLSGNFQKVVEDDDKILAIDSTIGPVYIDRSKAWFSLGEFRKSQSDIKKAANFGGYATMEFIKVLGDSLTAHHW
jgi:hypothetical protein